MNLLITVKSGYTPGAAWPLGDRPITIGRADNCDIIVEDLTVSRRHCQLSRHGNLVHLKDLGGRNPVLLNGVPALDAHLHVGDEFALGSVTFLVSATSSDIEGRTLRGAVVETRSIRLSELQIFDESLSDAGAGIWPGSVTDYVRLFHLSRKLSLAPTVSAILACLREAVQMRCQTGWTECLIYSDRRWTVLESGAEPPDFVLAESRTFARCLAERRALMKNIRTNGRHVNMMISPVICYEREVAVAVSFGNVREEADTSEDLILFAAMTEILGPFLHAALHMRAISELNRRHGSDLWGDPPIIGESAGARRLRDEIAETARMPLNVLILGETGTGKELVARNLHRLSDRAEANFVALNCAAVPDELFEAELFGHCAGAFTGALPRRGLLATADAGTLFLDEVGDLSPKNQARLLRALDQGTFRPLGEDREHQVDVRVIAASNVPLPNPQFRQDLYHRLAPIVIQAPPLRDRASDIPLLAQHFVDVLALEHPQLLCPISDEAFAWLQEQRWPGNIRELRHMVVRAAHRCRGGELNLGHLPAADPSIPGSQSMPLQSLEQVERDHIECVLEHCAGNMAKAARILRVSRTTLYAKVDAYGLRT